MFGLIHSDKQFSSTFNPVHFSVQSNIISCWSLALIFYVGFNILYQTGEAELAVRCESNTALTSLLLAKQFVQCA